MGDADDLEVVPSGVALQQVSAWLGVDAEAVLEQETDPAVEAMFNKPHPLLLGLGAKYLSHKSMEASGVEQKLRHKLRASTGADGRQQQQQYQPAQLDRHQHKRRKHEQQQQQGGHPGKQGQQLHHQRSGGADDSDSSDDEDAQGKLGKLQQAGANMHQRGSKQRSKVLDRSALLQVPTEQLSKWQRKRLREKAKKQQQQQQQQQQRQQQQQ